MFGLKKKNEMPEATRASLDAEFKPERRSGVISFYKAKDGWRWRLVVRNGRIVAESGEAYVRRYECRQAALRLAGVVARAEVEEVR
jgi:uncharacterized protein YegP (UPF0339 family)